MNYFFFFLTAATTVRVTQALATNDEPAATNTLSSCFTLALVSGVCLGAIIRSCAPRLVGFTGCVPELVPVAARYLRIRSLGQPVVLASMVTQVRGDRDEIATGSCRDRTEIAPRSQRHDQLMVWAGCAGGPPRTARLDHPVHRDSRRVHAQHRRRPPARAQARRGRRGVGDAHLTVCRSAVDARARCRPEAAARPNPNPIR